jgi:site-specific recombinase XerD
VKRSNYCIGRVRGNDGREGCCDVLGWRLQLWRNSSRLVLIPNNTKSQQPVREQLAVNALQYASLNTDGTALTGATVAGMDRRSMVAKGIRRLCQHAGIAHHSSHKLRHGYAVDALKTARDIADLKAVSQNLMHSSLTITDSIYGILTGGNVAERIAGLNRMEIGSEDVISQLERLLTQLKAGK